MTYEDKIQFIKDTRDAAIAAVTAYLDAIYELKEKYLNEDNSLKEGLEKDARAEQIIKSLQQDAIGYEKVRSKLINSDFNLSLVEIARIGLSFFYLKTQMENQITILTKGLDKTNEAISKLIDKTTQNIDFSEN